MAEASAERRGWSGRPATTWLEEAAHDHGLARRDHRAGLFVGTGPIFDQAGPATILIASLISLGVMLVAYALRKAFGPRRGILQR